MSTSKKRRAKLRRQREKDVASRLAEEMESQFTEQRLQEERRVAEENRRRQKEVETVRVRVKSFTEQEAPAFTPPPSHTVVTKGLPVVATNDCSEGFRGLGKLTGEHAKYWSIALDLLVDRILNIDFSDEYFLEMHEIPLIIEELSPHQQLRLLRDVAVGLCEETPLPPETIWHYAAFFSPVKFVLSSIKVQDETEFMVGGDLSEEESALNNAEQLVSHEFKKRRLAKNKHKSASDLMREVTTDAEAHYMQNLKHWRESASSCDCYAINEIAAETTEELTTESIYCKIVSSATGVNMDVEIDFDAAFFLDYLSIFKWPKGSNALFIDILFGTSFTLVSWNPLDHLIYRATRRASKLFAEKWAPDETAYDVC